MGFHVFKNNEDWHNAIYADVRSYRERYPKATVRDAIKHFQGTWSEDGVRHAWSRPGE